MVFEKRDDEMSNALANIEKLCLQALHDGSKDVCNFERDGLHFISDSYAVWVLDELGDCYVKYPKNEKFEEKLYNLVKKYEKVEPLLPMRQSHESVITRGFTASKYESALSAQEAWIQDKYIVLFEPFDPEFCVYPNWDESKPVIVMSGEYRIGLIMPMHITEECRAKKVQEKL